MRRPHPKVQIEQDHAEQKTYGAQAGIPARVLH